MEFSSSQSDEFFVAQEQPDDDRGDSRSMSPNRSEGPNLREPHSPQPQDQLPFMQLLPPPTSQCYPTLQALLEDVNKTASRQGYHVVKDGGDRKDKDGNLRKIRLKCRKGGVYKDGGQESQQGGRKRRRERTDCPWKAYAGRKEGEW